METTFELRKGKHFKMREMNATATKKQNMLRQQEQSLTGIIRNGNMVRGTSIPKRTKAAEGIKRRNLVTSRVLKSSNDTGRFSL